MTEKPRATPDFTKFVSRTLTLVPSLLVLAAAGMIFLAATPSVEQNARIQKAQSKGETEEAYIGLELTAEDDDGNTVATDKAIGIYLHSDATDEWDAYDASKIIPSLIDEYALLAFVGEKNEETVLKAQESRPYLSDSVEVVETRLIRSDALPAGLTYTLRVTDWYDVPSGWSVEIHSPVLESPLVFDNETSSSTFTLNEDSKRQAGTTAKSDSDTTHFEMTSEIRPASSALPVELVGLSAESNGNQVFVRWQTASETNNAGFILEHRPNTSSSDEWAELEFFEGAGTTTQAQNYQYRSDELDYGDHLFRLRQVDTDGTTTTSRPIRTSLQLDGGHVVSSPYPNPVREMAVLEVTVRDPQPLRIDLYDVQGRRVQTVFDGTLSGQQTHRVQVLTEGLSSNTYFLRIEGDAFAETRRLTVVR